MNQNRVWIVCPCFFDIASFKRLKENIEQILAPEKLNFSLHFILIDDSAGTDPQLKELESSPNLQIFPMPYNMGHQAALVYTLRRLKLAEADFVITMDADGEDRPEHITNVLQPLIENSNSLLRVSLAARTERSEKFGFKLGYFFFKKVFRLLTGTVIKNGNFAGFRGKFLQELIFHPHFDLSYASTFISIPLQITFVPLPRGNRYYGESKMNFISLLTHGLKMLMPFTEKIAARGVIASCFLALWCIFAFFLSLRNSPLLALIAFLCIIAFLLITGLFVLLFATFSQSKSTRLWKSE